MVDVLICTYNSQDYICQSLDSVINQTLKPNMIIVVDDCSNDSTFWLLKKYEEKSIIPIKLIRNTINIGLTKSLNIGLNSSKSSLIARLDSDDYWDSEKLEIQVNFLNDNPSIDFCCTNVNLTNDFSKKYIKSQKLNINNFPYTNPFNHSSLVIYKDVLNNVNNYNELYKYSQDYELYYKLFNSGYNGYIINNYLVFRRISKNILGFKKRRQQIFFLVLAQSKILFSKKIIFNRFKLTLIIMKNLLRIILSSRVIKFLKK